MVGGHSAASSLYAGVFDKKSVVDKNEASGPTANGQESGTGKEAGSDSSRTAEEKTVEKSQAWSAALRFAPRKNVNKAKKSAAYASPAVLSAAFASSSAVEPLDEPSVKAHEDRFAEQQKSASAEISSSSKVASHQIETHALTVARDLQDTIASLPLVTAPPSLTLTEAEIEKEREYRRKKAFMRSERIASDESQKGRTDYNDDPEEGFHDDDGVDDDVNGFMNTAEGKKAAKKRHKRKRNMSPGHRGGLSASLNMDADYDARVPNDFFEFKALLRRRKEADEQSTDRYQAAFPRRDMKQEEGVDGESSDEERQRGRKLGKFAPPASYGTPVDISNRTEEKKSFDAHDDEKPYLSPAPPVPNARPPEPPPGPPPGPPPRMPQQGHALTGEEAYLRRLAMSTAQISPSVSQANGDDGQEMKMRSHGHQLPDDSSANSDATRTAAAAAIAARLSQEAPPNADSTTNEDRVQAFPEPSASTSMSFAERLMTKQGWRKGDALGVEGNKGLLQPILAQKVDSHGARRDAHTSSYEREPRTGPRSARGTIVSTQEESRRREERLRYGEASEIILLENMLRSDDDIDDDLTDEIGEECAKHGYVERVFIWPASSSTSASTKPRVFVQFTGMAGAWRCLKDLDGRFFAGNTVRARYYPTSLFAKGEYDVSVTS